MTSTSDGHVPQRQTKQRTEIKEAVGEIDGFATSQEVHDQMRRNGSAVGLATVYRTLQTMASTGELDAIRTSAGQIAYRTCSPSHHHHLICRSCGRTEEINVPEIETMARTIAADHDFAHLDHELEFLGICAQCDAAKTPANP